MQPATPAPWRRWRVIFLCSLAMTFAFMDRQILPLFIEPVRADLHITDVQFSLLTGLAFSIFYGLCGIPIGRLVDSKSRPLILGIGLTVWSAATALTGFSRSFTQVFIARMAVGVGEATVSPASQSMATDLFFGRALGRAISTVSLGVGIGGGAALLLGGSLARAIGPAKVVHLPLVGDLHPWQFVFLVLGLPGLLLAPVMLFTVKDPARIRLALDVAGGPAKPAYLSMLRFVLTHRATVALNACGYVCFSLGSGALSQWAPAHLIRTFHAPVGQVGMTLGLSQMIGTTAGLLFAGRWIDRNLNANRADAAMRFSLTTAALALPPMLLFPFMPSLGWSIAMIVVAGSLCGAGYATVAVGQQQLLPNQMRAQFSATYLVLSNLIGGTLGPFLVASLNTDLFHDPRRIGVSAAIVGGVGLASAVTLLGLGLRPFRASMDLVDRAVAGGANT